MVLLEGADEDMLRSVAAASPHGVGLWKELARRVGDAKDQGFAVSHGEREVGVSGVAVPVRNTRGDVVAALVLAGPTQRFTADLQTEAVALLTVHAPQVSDALRAAGVIG